MSKPNTTPFQHDDVVTFRGVRLARRTTLGKRGGLVRAYQAETASRVWGYWYDSAAKAARASNSSDRVVQS
mgnify:FL=1